MLMILFKHGTVKCALIVWQLIMLISQESSNGTYALY